MENFSRDHLLLNLFIYGQGWIPSVYAPIDGCISPIHCNYNERQYVLDNPSVLRWIEKGNDNIHIPTSLFEEIIGEYPDLLPTAKEDIHGRFKILDTISLQIECPKKRVMSLLLTSLLLNYLGAYDSVWSLQKEIYLQREYLPASWQKIGGITLNDKDEKVRKWNGDWSPYWKSNFNGMYVPYGLSEMASSRFILHKDIYYHSEMYVLVTSPLIQSLSFGINPPFETISNDLLSAISIVGTGKKYQRDESPQHPLPDTIAHQEKVCDILQQYQSGVPLEDMLSITPISTLKEKIQETISSVSVSEVLQSWDLYSYCDIDVKKKKLSPALYNLIENEERLELLEEMPEEDLVSVANTLELSVPYEDGEISLSQLILCIRDKILELLPE